MYIKHIADEIMLHMYYYNYIIIYMYIHIADEIMLHMYYVPRV